MLGMAARELTKLPLIHIEVALSWRTESRNPYSGGSRRGGMQGYRVKVRKAKRLVRVRVRRMVAKVGCEGAM